MTDERRKKDRRADVLDADIDLLMKIRKRLGYVDQRMDDMAAGWRTGGQGGGETLEDEAFEYQSVTEANALNPQRDIVRPDKRRKDQLMREITERIHALDDIDRKYLGGGDGTRPPDPPGCEVVGRFKSKDGRRLWASVDRHTDGTAFLVDASAEFHKGSSIGVCNWAYDFGRRVGRWPYRAEVEAHLAGRDVKALPVEQTQAKVQRIKRGWRRSTRVA